MAKLAIKNENVTPFGGIYHIMDVFSKLGLGNRRLGLVKPGSHVDLDFDHQFMPAHKFDAKYSYKQDFGYSYCISSVSRPNRYAQECRMS